jgi:hypothetical protein
VRGSFALVAVVVVVVVVLVAGCGSTVSSPPPSVAPTGVPSLPASGLPSVRTSSSPGDSPGASVAPTSSGPTIDGSLLELLPATLGGLDRQTDADVDREIAADPALAAVASRFASALYIAPSTGDLAYALVAATRAALSEGELRSWRDSYDVGFCSQAGGVRGHAEAEIGGRRTWITTCTGGAIAYYFVLAAPPALVTVTSVGSMRLGEQLVAAVHG